VDNLKADRAGEVVAFPGFYAFVELRADDLVVG
jgi:hypothetical protein